MPAACDVPIPTKNPPEFVSLKWWGERRDGFLVAGAILYGLGYVVWSYNAYRNHLGQLPALEFQYLAAGIIPACILVLTLTGLLFFSRLSDWLRALYKQHPHMKWVVALAAASPALFAPILGVVHNVWPQSDAIMNRVIPYSLPILSIGLYLSLVRSGDQPQDKRTRYAALHSFGRRCFAYAIPVMFLWICLRLYLDLYQRLPQELGGPHPRCAYVDLVRDETAPTTLTALATPSATEPSARVIRSNRLDVYFANSDYLLVRSATSSAQPYSNSVVKAEPVYELRKEVIRAVQWCE